MGQCVTRPRNTTGSVDSSRPAGSARASTPVTSRIFSAFGNIQLAGALDEVAEVRERGDDHVDGQQVAALVQLAQRRDVEFAQPFLLDGVEAREAVLGAVQELDVEHK